MEKSLGLKDGVQAASISKFLKLIHHEPQGKKKHNKIHKDVKNINCEINCLPQDTIIYFISNSS